MKLYKLNIHPKTFNVNDLLLNAKDHPDVKLYDIVEIYHPEDEGFRLLLQVTNLTDDQREKGRDIISVESNIAATFNLRNYADVIMHLVNPASVALDSVEITFKDQYMGRYEMWRLKTNLTNTCVYLNKKIEFPESSLRCQVYEMWSQGERVACGVINEDTKIVFRSSTSMVYLFIQMSSEMWDFDIHGDLYFEKAVNGFLSDLFTKWKKLGSNPEVTIVLFSRTFYSAKSLDEFPLYMRECLQMDYKGRFYEDFYRVAIQNERNDDWSTILVQLRRLFTAYQNTVLRYHERANFAIPQASNSTAAQGNFLEVLNISLNVFEKHYLDRSFDRTGQLSVVITPGVGVFEVDRELTNITKQRIIDNGVGSDLVCVGEQPLHAVPLLKFHNKTSSLSAADDYSMPHWINLSFYSTNKKVAYSTFIPRIKLPPLVSQQHCSLEDNKENQKLKFSSDNQTEYIHNSLFDYDAYDAQIFTIPPAHGTCSLQRAPRTKKTSVPSLDAAFICRELEALSPPKQAMRRKMSDPDIHHGTSNVLANLSHNGSPISDSTSAIEKQAKKSIINSPGPIIRAGRALINPFDPSHVTIKLTSNRRRWTHIFPKGPTGVLIQQHHYQAVPAKNGAKCYSRMLESTGSSSDFVHTSTCTAAKSESVHSDNGSDGTLSRRKISTLHSAAGPLATVESSKSLTLLWGATGEQEWTPALTTAGKIIIGVDWKSLTIPACLPITTDYFPDKRSLYNDYLVSDYTLLPEDVNADYAQKRAVYRKPLTTEQVFKELISQRLAQGFQWIVLPDKAPCCGGSLQFQAKQPSLSVIKMLPPQEATKEYLLSVGRIFHKISLIGSVITVTRYRPRHPCKPINVDYRYRFHAPQHDIYEVSGVNFTTEKLENFSWNYMDQYICTRGDTDYPLMESLKYWRFRMYLLPKEHPAMKKILDGQSNRCDIFTEISPDSCKQNADEFLRFVETHINKIKRPAMNCNKSKARGSPATVTQHQQQLQQQQPQSHLTRRRHSTSILSRPPPNQNNHISNSPFRERVGSNRLPEKRPRSGSKVIEKGPGRVSPASEAVLNNESVSMDYGSDEAFVTETKLKSNASLLEIYEAMKHPETGVGFLAPTQGTPSCTFASYDAVSWLMARVENCSDPVHILETMRKEKLICHASGTFSKPIIVGFYLYFIVQQDKTSKEYMPPLCDLESFENEWMEVEIVNPDACITDIRERVVPRFLRNNVELQVKDGPIYKQAHLEIGMKGDRIEWGHKRYHDKMTPGHAFELVVQWLTASGSNVHDVVYGWQRKAQQCQFQLIAIPADPLAAPFTEKSDPLRGPIFIPLDIECIKQHRTFLFEEFSEDTWADRMLLFQEAIVERFGFMPCRVETKTGSNQVSFNNQYVHCSANMFILVASPHEEVKGKQRETPTGRSFTAHSYESKYLESYITRHVGKKNEAAADAVKRLGFLWSWNHMIPNKKWKSLMINNSPDNELFQLKMLRDFKDFCSNQSNRLVNFWEQCWKTKEKMSSNSD